MTKIIITIFFTTLLVSCFRTKPEKDNYPKNQSISDNQGKPKDSLTFYFPASIQLDTNIVTTEIDTFMLNWFSSALYAAKEPILYNYYLGHDIYRFLWLRSFNRPVIISLHKDRTKVWLTTKQLNKEPEFLDEYTPVDFVPPKLLPNEEGYTTEVVKTKKHKRELIKKADRKANITFNQTISLTKKEWTEFETLLNSCSFWTSKPCIDFSGCDGSRWIIEGQLNNKYWFINRWSPRDNFRNAGEYLIKKSGLNEKIY
jgi:hypothetical protein